MGLDTTHNAWYGAYSAFMRWREKIQEVSGLPPLRSMEGFKEHGGLKWDEKHPLTPLLNHSDCDGYINWSKLSAIADALEKLLPLLDEDGGGHIGNYADKTRQFIDGCRLAVSEKKKLEFR